MLLSLLYHHVGKGKYANPLPLLEKHFAWIAHHYPTSLPGEKLQSGLNICLSFDDASFDFYHFIFPLLKRYQLKALLAVPVSFIPEDVTLCPELRLQQIRALSETDRAAASPAFCSWHELREIERSKLIQIASHSMSHLPLTVKKIDLQYELLISKQILEQKLERTIDTFVYPYGRLNRTIHTIAKKYYTYLMRIGSAVNFDWQSKKKLLYRVPADNLPHYQSPFAFHHQLKYLTRFLLNNFRHK